MGARIAKRRAAKHIAPMTIPAARLGFFKLNVTGMDAAVSFWCGAFGFAITTSFDEPDFVEHILALPGQETGPNLLLVSWKDGRDCRVGAGHGPVGLFCSDIAASRERALACGARALTEIFEAGPVKVAMLESPQGHEIELVQLPAG